MSKSELVAVMAKRAGLSQNEAERALDAFWETVCEALRDGEKIQLVGYGTFEVRERAARTGRNPQTGETIDIPAGRAPAFKPGKILKEIVQ